MKRRLDLRKTPPERDMMKELNMSGQRDLPLVSCIIAVYNGQTYLHEAIDSLLAQTYPREVEIVIVNDGSTDGTADVINRYGDRVRALSQDNQGVSIARNRGVDMANRATVVLSGRR